MGVLADCDRDLDLGDSGGGMTMGHRLVWLAFGVAFLVYGWWQMQYGATRHPHQAQFLMSIGAGLIVYAVWPKNRKDK